jgi:hypothetical protein
MRVVVGDGQDGQGWMSVKGVVIVVVVCMRSDESM